MQKFAHLCTPVCTLLLHLSRITVIQLFINRFILQQFSHFFFYFFSCCSRHFLFGCKNFVRPLASLRFTPLFQQQLYQSIFGIQFRRNLINYIFICTFRFVVFSLLPVIVAKQNIPIRI